MRSTGLCTCADPIPVQQATRKGAAQTICLRCGRPPALRLTTGRRLATTR